MSEDQLLVGMGWDLILVVDEVGTGMLRNMTKLRILDVAASGVSKDVAVTVQALFDLIGSLADRCMSALTSMHHLQIQTGQQKDIGVFDGHRHWAELLYTDA